MSEPFKIKPGVLAIVAPLSECTKVTDRVVAAPPAEEEPSQLHKLVSMVHHGVPRHRDDVRGHRLDVSAKIDLGDALFIFVIAFL